MITSMGPEKGQVRATPVAQHGSWRICALLAEFEAVLTSGTAARLQLFANCSGAKIPRLALPILGRSHAN
jgi:hypothetical protein